MKNKLQILQEEAMKNYSLFKSELINLNEYLQSMKPLDDEIDKMELYILSQYLEDNLAFEKSSLKQLHLSTHQKVRIDKL